MELTKRALGFLRRQYSLILKKNHLSNALAVAGLSVALSSGAMVGVAHAGDADADNGYTKTLDDSTLVDFTVDNIKVPDQYSEYEDDWGAYKNNLSISSGYNVVGYQDTTDYYTTFTQYTANDDGTLSSVSYGILLGGSSKNSVEGYITNYSGTDYTFTTTAPDENISDYASFMDSDGIVYYVKDGDSYVTSAKGSNANGTVTGAYIGNTSTTTSGSTETTIGGAEILKGDNHVATVNGTFIANTANVGGALYHESSSITSIDGNFIGNSSTNRRGAAIANMSGLIGTITGDFIANNASGYGAINNTGTIGVIVGSFIGNYTSNTIDGIGGAIYNKSSESADGVIDTIIADFIGNSSYNYGGAIVNANPNGSTYDAVINAITGDFICNTSTSSNGGAIVNIDLDGNGNITTTIGTITGNFIGNSGNSGGAIYTNGTINTITGDFYENIARSGDGGAIYNVGIIGSIVSNFSGNSAGRNGGAIYTSQDLTFLADDQVLYFTNNYTGTETSKTYNAIYSTSGVTLTFDMDGTGDFIMNDSITGAGYTSTKGDTYNVAIVGVDEGNGVAEENYFYLNDIVDDNGTVTVTNANLTLGTYTHDDDSVTMGDMYFTDALLGDNAELYINVGTAYSVVLDSDENLTVGSDDEFIVQSGTFDISAGTLTVHSGAIAYETETDGILRVNIANYGYYVADGGNELTYYGTTLTSDTVSISGETVQDLIQETLDNAGELVLVYDGLEINKVDYINLLNSIDTTDWTSELESGDNVISSTDNVTVEFANISLTGYYSLNTFSYIEDSGASYVIGGSTVELNEFIMAGDLASGSTITAVGIVINDEEFDSTVTDSIVAEDATLTLTGASFYTDDVTGQSISTTIQIPQIALLLQQVVRREVAMTRTLIMSYSTKAR